MIESKIQILASSQFLVRHVCQAVRWKKTNQLVRTPSRAFADRCLRKMVSNLVQLNFR